MNRKVWIYICGIACLMAGALVVAQVPGGNPRPEIAEVAEKFLNASCPDKEQEAALVKQLRTASAESEAYFKQVILDGSPAAEEAERTAARALYAKRKEFDKRHRVVREGYENQAAGSETLEQYVDRRVRDWKRNREHRALQGLIVVGTPTAREFVQAQAKDLKSRWHEEAKELLEGK